MNPCDALEIDLSAYLDGECAPEASARVESHLTTCAACRQALESWRGLGDRMRAEDDTPAEYPRVRAAISKALTEESAAAPPRRARALPFRLAAAAALAVSAGAALYAWTRDRDDATALAELEGTNRAEALAQRRALEALRLEIGALRVRARAAGLPAPELNDLDARASRLLEESGGIRARVDGVEAALERSGLLALYLTKEGSSHGR
jgi:anti-sigma factor RsiW